jgi:tRNA nucleotidyltransferase (CCA-adding enzyme)
MPIREAALRRDVRMNSCAYDPLTETLYDPFDGTDNVRRKLIEVTDPVTFQEDPLRILRIMQFAGRFGFEVGEATKALCRQMVERGDIDTLSMDRIAKEMKKLILKSKVPSCGLRFALEIGIVEKYWPELHALIGVKQEPGWHPEGDVWTHTLQVMDAAVLVANQAGLNDRDREILLWASLTHDLGKPVTTTNGRRGHPLPRSRGGRCRPHIIFSGEICQSW